MAFEILLGEKGFRWCKKCTRIHEFIIYTDPTGITSYKSNIPECDNTWQSRRKAQVSQRSLLQEGEEGKPIQTKLNFRTNPTEQQLSLVP